MDPQDKMDEGVTELVVKGGETYMDAFLKRSRLGVSIKVTLHPIIEDFMRTLGNGSVQNVLEYGRYWTPVGRDKLLVYALIHDPGVMVSNSRTSYYINRPGSALQGTNDILGGGGDESVNLSFIRLVGASDEKGVTFAIKGVFSEAAIQGMARSIGNGLRAFCADYIKPVSCNVKIVRQEW